MEVTDNKLVIAGPSCIRLLDIKKILINDSVNAPDSFDIPAVKFVLCMEQLTRARRKQEEK